MFGTKGDKHPLNAALMKKVESITDASVKAAFWTVIKPNT